MTQKMTRCPVCGKDFLRITAKHIHSHGMTWNEYTRLKASDAISQAELRPSEVIKEFSDLLSLGGKDSSKELTLKEIKTRWDEKSKYLMSVLSTYEITRITRLLNYLEMIESRLFTPDKLNVATPGDLSRLYAQATQEMHIIFSRLEKLPVASQDDYGKLNAPPIVQVNVQQNNTTVVGLPQDSLERDKIRKAADALLTQLVEVVDGPKAAGLPAQPPSK